MNTEANPKETTMTKAFVANPSKSIFGAFEKGSTVKINGKATKYTVTFISSNFIGIEGPRGGWATFVPSTDGTAIQITRVGGKRDWVTEIEITSPFVPSTDGTA